MDVHGKKTVLTGSFRAGSRSEIKRRLEALGGKVTGSLSTATDLVFAGHGAGEKKRDAERIGTALLTEEDLYEVLLRGEQKAAAPAVHRAGSFVDHDALTVGRDDPAALLDLLAKADWAEFVPERDLPLLRECLTACEAVHGIGEAHRLATERIRDRGARLRHPYPRGGEQLDFGLSPCGRYLAIGRWVPADEYDGVGPLQVWELSTGRCVNALEHIPGGVGWPGIRDTIQWSADGTRVALAFRTNSVGLWDPFGRRMNPFGTADVTNGLDRAPDFAFAPHDRRAYVSMGSQHQVMGCVAELDQGRIFHVNGYGRHDVGVKPEMLSEPLPQDIRRRLGEDEWTFRRVRWSPDGTRLLGHNGPWACAVDMPGGRMRWLARTDGPVVWSPDGRFAASITPDSSVDERRRLIILDADTGEQVAEPAAQVPGALHWGMHGGAARLAVVAEDSRGVDIYQEDGRHQYHLDITATQRIGDHHFDGLQRPWAWEPQGGSGACLTVDGRVEVWTLNDEPSRLRSLEVPEGTEGLVWGADGVLAAIGSNTLRFIRARTSEVLGDFVFGDAEEEKTGQVVDGEGLTDVFSMDAFPLDASTWCALAKPAAGPGASLVIAAEERRTDLDAVLAWTVDQRFAWPVRWGGEHALSLVTDIGEAAAALRH
ncbi:WD40 repeat domain-containing protein [Streptomyces oceani]|uniref:WD40 repeat domain-containing protein n=1 Tax=Streptomyces oceani TaxID=1075402 RepID=UPI000872B092|nr:WD40 repeat domain-containing protein [Streptomyces oceani]